jgi:hypothetical protein
MRLPDSPPPPSRAAFIRRLKLRHHHQRSHLFHTEKHNHKHVYDDDDDDNDDHYGDDETEREPLPGLSSCSSKSSTPEAQSPISPDDDGHHDDRWILSPARDEELKEWEQYLDEAGENRLSSDPRRASSAGWSSIALSCEVMLSNSPTTAVAR